MTLAYRICKAKYAKAAFSGEGARIAGGRWSFPGERVVYCSSSLALAALETWVHLGEEARSISFVSFEVGIPDDVRIDRVKKPPQGWRAEPPGAASQKVGSKWLEKEKTVGLLVPSALVPDENNILLNPAHRNFRRLRVSGWNSFYFDPRMWK